MAMDVISTSQIRLPGGNQMVKASAPSSCSMSPLVSPTRLVVDLVMETGTLQQCGRPNATNLPLWDGWYYDTTHSWWFWGLVHDWVYDIRRNIKHDCKLVLSSDWRASSEVPFKMRSPSSDWVTCVVHDFAVPAQAPKRVRWTCAEHCWTDPATTGDEPRPAILSKNNSFARVKPNKEIALHGRAGKLFGMVKGFTNIPESPSTWQPHDTRSPGHFVTSQTHDVPLTIEHKLPKSKNGWDHIWYITVLPGSRWLVGPEI